MLETANQCQGIQSQNCLLTQSSFSGGTEIEFSENDFGTLLAGADKEQEVENFNFRTEDF